LSGGVTWIVGTPAGQELQASAGVEEQKLPKSDGNGNAQNWETWHFILKLFLLPEF